MSLDTPPYGFYCARALRFLNHNTTLGVTYKRQEQLYLDGWVDASHGNEVHHAFGPLAARCQRHSHNHTPNHTGRVILPPPGATIMDSSGTDREFS